MPGARDPAVYNCMPNDSTRQRSLGEEETLDGMIDEVTACLRLFPCMLRCLRYGMACIGMGRDV